MSKYLFNEHIYDPSKDHGHGDPADDCFVVYFQYLIKLLKNIIQRVLMVIKVIYSWWWFTIYNNYMFYMQIQSVSYFCSYFITSSFCDKQKSQDSVIDYRNIFLVAVIYW